MVRYAPICLECTHWKKKEDGMKCDAFPSGIPLDILISRLDHTKTVFGDRGIFFDPVKPDDIGSITYNPFLTGERVDGTGE